MAVSFVNDQASLTETDKTEDLLDVSIEANLFSARLGDLHASSTIALVGPFGSGKSTLLHQVKLNNKDQVWLEFDAWKFPDRKDLWEGFVLEIAKQVSNEDFEEVLKKIEGEQNADKKTLIDTLADFPFPGMAVIRNLKHFFRTSPARRVFEIQEILKDLLERSKQDVFIVIEDIDRSGDAGVFFLETLKHFLHRTSLDKRVICVVPMAGENFEKYRASFLKCIDYVEFFSPAHPKLEKFVTKVFRSSLVEDQIAKAQITSFLEGLFKINPDTTLRLIKLILRKADINYQNQQAKKLEPDWRVTIVFEAAKYFTKKQGAAISYFDSFKESGIVARGNLFHATLAAILQKSINIYRHNLNGSDAFLQLPTDIKLVHVDALDKPGQNLSIPWRIQFPEEGFEFMNSDYYLYY